LLGSLRAFCRTLRSEASSRHLSHGSAPHCDAIVSPGFLKGDCGPADASPGRSPKGQRHTNSVESLAWKEMKEKTFQWASGDALT